MGKKAELIVRVEMASDGIPYGSFIAIMNNAIGMLRSIANNMEADDATWLITKATTNSPLCMTITARSKKKPRVVKRAVKTFVRGIHAIEHGAEPPPEFSYKDLESAKRMVSVLADGVKGLSFTDSDGEVAQPTLHLAANVQSIQDTLYHYEWASFRGVLENITTHGDSNVFSIFDSLTDHEIPCHFSDEDTARVGSMIKKRINVYGRTRFDRSGLPIHIDVEEFHTVCGDEDLIKISEAPPTNITGGMDSVEYVRRIRDGKSF